MLQIDKPSWLERNIVNIIAGACTVIVAAVLGTLITAVNLSMTQAQTAQEIRDIGIQTRTNAARINELAAEQSWIRNSVKIQVEMMK